MDLLRSAVELKPTAGQEVRDATLDMVLDRKHLAAKRPLPYAARGEGYEVADS